MDLNDFTTGLLLGLTGLVFASGFIVFGWALAVNRHPRRKLNQLSHAQTLSATAAPRPRRPICWLAIRSVSPECVKSVLGLNHAAPCSWAEGLTGSHEFFISPRVHGWIIVTGLGLPNPTDDVDATFLFLTALSRKLGHVQYFYASRRLQHHSWARLDDGCVTRAYAWAGETVWDQGAATRPEVAAKVKLFGYGDDSATVQDTEGNYQKVSRLAAQWSLDPALVKLDYPTSSIGIAGESELMRG